MNREERKRQLIAQGAIYRAEVMLAKQAARASLRSGTLARSILHQAVGAAISAFRGGSRPGLAGVNLQTLLPIIMGGISALSKRKSLLKTIARGAAVASAAAGVVVLVSRKKKVGSTTSADAPKLNDL